MKEASKLLEGYHDFRTFKAKDSDIYKVTRKNIDFIKIIENNIPGYSKYSWPTFMKYENVDCLPIDIYIKGSSFVYRQVNVLKFPP